MFRRCCQSTASTSLLLLLYLHRTPPPHAVSVIPISLPASSHIMSCHDRAAKNLMGKKPQEKNEREHHICLNDLLHPRTPHWLQTCAAAATIGLLHCCMCTHTHTHTPHSHYESIFGSMARYWTILRGAALSSLSSNSCSVPMKETSFWLIYWAPMSKYILKRFIHWLFIRIT